MELALASWPVWLSPWEWSSSDWAGLTFLVVVAAALVAWRQVNEARRLREEQARPFVVIDFDVWRSNVINLKIKNTGTTLARDVQFAFDPPLTAAKDAQPGLVPIAEANLFKSGIPALPPGKQITFFFDQYPSRAKQGLPDRYDVRVSYLDPAGKRYSEPTVLDLGIYLEVSEVTRYEIHDVHARLKEISATLKKWTHPDGLKVMTREDRKRYRDELEARDAEREQAAAANEAKDNT